MGDAGVNATLVFTVKNNVRNTDSYIIRIPEESLDLSSGNNQLATLGCEWVGGSLDGDVCNNRGLVRQGGNVVITLGADSTVSPIGIKFSGLKNRLYAGTVRPYVVEVVSTGKIMDTSEVPLPSQFIAAPFTMLDVEYPRYADLLGTLRVKFITTNALPPGAVIGVTVLDDFTLPETPAALATAGVLNNAAAGKIAGVSLTDTTFLIQFGAESVASGSLIDISLPGVRNPPYTLATTTEVATFLMASWAG